MTQELSEMIAESRTDYDGEFVIWGEYAGELIGARPLEMTIEKLREVYDKHSVHPSLFSDLVDHSFGRFAAYLINNARFVTEVVSIPEREHLGFLYLTDLLVNEQNPSEIASAYGHFSFWSGKLGDGRRTMVREIIDLFARGFNIHRLSVRIPVYAPGAIRAASKIGFTGDFAYQLPKSNRDIMIEALLRKAIKYKGEWWDVLILSLVGDELWASNQQPKAQE